MVKIGSPVLFAQERPGLHGEIFKLCKFRTMTNERDENGELLPDEQRLTSFGKLLRSTSLDELPEIFLILSGRLSICGDGCIIVTTRKSIDFFKGCYGLSWLYLSNYVTSVET